MKYFALAMPGVGSILAREISQTPELSPSDDACYDGRNDVIPFSAERAVRDPFTFRSSEDVYVEVAVTRRVTELPTLVRDLTDDTALERALSVFAHQVQPLRAQMRYRVITRVLSESHFRRTNLREALSAQIGSQRPRWKLADPAEIELWVLETKPGQFRSGLRLTDSSMRHRESRKVERDGALRPSVAGAMLVLANPATGALLLDPFCGSGTILREALDYGARAAGFDVDPAAVAAAKTNVAQAAIAQADARHMPFPDAASDAIVTNLPFGGKYRVSEPLPRWFSDVLSELTRVTRKGGSIVLLVPPSQAFTRALAKNATLRLVQQFPLRLLGFSTAMWHFTRSES